MAKAGSAQKASSKSGNTSNHGDAALAKAYNEVPYTSYPFAQTGPELLQGMARLFGLSAPAPATARVLEIGCSSGNNIIAVAARHPQSVCVGLDYAVRQIETGQKQVKELGLRNMELKHLSIMDVDKSFGMFDYIICHGVLSWVPPEVQEKILEVCGANLSPDGVAYVSYNTLPGWNSVRSVREMMIYHTAMYDTPAEKAQAARQVLKFIGDSAKINNNKSISQIIERELEILNNQPDYYLLHEHLEENNYQFYFHQFMALAQKNKLQYLAETSLEKMYSGNFAPEISKVLATSNDIVRTEQYMDFIYDRRFRSTLLCHADRILSRNLQNATLLEGCLLNRFTFPENFAGHDLSQPVKLQFTSATGMTLTSDDPLAIAIMKELQESGAAPANVPELVEKVTTRLKKLKHPLASAPQAEREETICGNLMRYIFIGGLYFFLKPPPYQASVSAMPEAAALARYQATQQGWVTSQRQEHITLSPFDARLLPLANGTRDRQAMVKALLPFFESGDLVMNEGNAAITDIKMVEQKLAEFVKSALERYAQLALLVK